MLTLLKYAKYAAIAYSCKTGIPSKHGLFDDSLHDIFRASPSQNSCKSYASNSWWGFSNANDRRKIFAFFRRCIRTGFCSPDLADFHDLYISLDEKLFNKILSCANHILRSLLICHLLLHKISLRNRPHNK